MNSRRRIWTGPSYVFQDSTGGGGAPDGGLSPAPGFSKGFRDTLTNSGMPLTAITRAVSQCQVAFVKRQPIDLAKAIDQHNRYEACLAALGIEIVSLPAAPDLPDAVFVEDPAIILDEVAVMTRMGAESRRGESESLAQAVARFRPLRWITDPGTLEGGDVVRIGAALFVGRSGRSNAAGIAQLERE